MIFFVAKDGAVYLQITHELHEIRKKYENHEKSANLSTKDDGTIFYPFM